jgi:hypothetical protein
MGNNHSNNDYRPDPTTAAATARADRIRGGSAGGADKERGSGEGKKNGYRGSPSQQLAAGQSPSHNMMAAMAGGQLLSSQVARWARNRVEKKLFQKKEKNHRWQKKTFAKSEN